MMGQVAPMSAATEDTDHGISQQPMEVDDDSVDHMSSAGTPGTSDRMSAGHRLNGTPEASASTAGHTAAAKVSDTDRSNLPGLPRPLSFEFLCGCQAYSRSCIMTLKSQGPYVVALEALGSVTVAKLIMTQSQRMQLQPVGVDAHGVFATAVEFAGTDGILLGLHPSGLMLLHRDREAEVQHLGNLKEAAMKDYEAGMTHLHHQLDLLEGEMMRAPWFGDGEAAPGVLAHLEGGPSTRPQAGQGGLVPYHYAHADNAPQLQVKAACNTSPGSTSMCAAYLGLHASKLPEQGVTGSHDAAVTSTPATSSSSSSADSASPHAGSTYGHINKGLLCFTASGSVSSVQVWDSQQGQALLRLQALVEVVQPLPNHLPHTVQPTDEAHCQLILPSSTAPRPTISNAAGDDMYGVDTGLVCNAVDGDLLTKTVDKVAQSLSERTQQLLAVMQPQSNYLGSNLMAKELAALDTGVRTWRQVASHLM